jgi:cytochrome P450
MAYRRAVQSAFSLSALLKYEKFLDETGEVLVAKLRAKVEAGEESIDLPRWLQNYAFDTVATVCYSKPYGFLEQDVDIDSIIKTTRMILDYTSHVSPPPPFERWHSHFPPSSEMLLSLTG